MCFIAGGKLLSGSFQSQQKLLKNTVKWKCETFWSTLSASFSALRLLIFLIFFSVERSSATLWNWNAN